MEKTLHQNSFEQIETRFEHERGNRTAEICLSLGSIAMRFSQVERVPRYETGERENDVEHSYMLALVAPELAQALEFNLDAGLISQYAIVHDLVELQTGDQATFLFTENDQHAKEASEHAALQQLASLLPPHTRSTLLMYEAQRDPEARFVRYVDKLLPLVVDVVGQGERVMREDYQVTDTETLRQCHEVLHERIVAKFGGEFADLDIAHEILCELFQFIATTRNPTVFQPEVAA